jgi:hypothetical protein
VYKITPAANLDGGKITAATEEAVAGLPTRLVIEPTVAYGVDEGSIAIYNSDGNNLWSTTATVTRVEDAVGIQYDFIMPDQDVVPTASFFRLKGTVQVTGYKPVKIEAFEEGADYEWLPIAETTTFGLPTADYAWTIDPKSYVYTNDGTTTGWTRNVIFRITLTSTDGTITYPYTVKRSISNLYNESNYAVYIPVNTLSNVYAKELTDTSITLSWDQAAWAVGGYQVYRNDGGSYVKVGNVIALDKTKETAEYLDTGLQFNYTYNYYVVGLIDTNGTEGNISYINVKTSSVWILQGNGRYKSPTITHDETTKQRYNFATTSPDTYINVYLEVSSEQNYDWAFVSSLDNPNATYSNGYETRISGENSTTIAIYVPTAGSHFIEIGYGKDSSVSSGSDCAWFLIY